MLLSALEPALLIYRYEDWRRRDRHCLSRFEALTLHRGINRKYGQKIAMSDMYAAEVCQSFPWKQDCRGIDQLRDLRQLVIEELQRAHYLDATTARSISVWPPGVVCEHVDDADAEEAFTRLLSACLEEAAAPGIDAQVATWERDSVCSGTGSLRCTIAQSEQGGDSRDEYVPLVWDHISWALQLNTQKWWPDLQRCVELFFLTDPAMRAHPAVRDRSMTFECSPRFWQSVNDYCRDEQLRRLLTKAVAKTVYGLRDAALCDEAFGQMRRFRVTDFWRVHYREQDDHLVLEEFGRHDMATPG